MSVRSLYRYVVRSLSFPPSLQTCPSALVKLVTAGSNFTQSGETIFAEGSGTMRMGGALIFLLVHPAANRQTLAAAKTIFLFINFRKIPGGQYEKQRRHLAKASPHV